MSNKSISNPVNDYNIPAHPTLILEGMEKLLGQAEAIIFLKDVNLRYVAASPPLAAMIGKTSVAELIGHTDLEVFEDSSLANRYMADDKQVLESGRDLLDYVEPIRGENGEVRYASTSKYPIRDNEGKIIGILGICKDITKHIRAREHYDHTVKYLFSLPDDTFSAVLIDVDSWRIIAHQKQDSLKDNMPVYVSVEQFKQDVLSVISDEQCEAYHFYEQLSPEVLKDIYASGKSEFHIEHQNTPPDGNAFWSKDAWKFLVDPESGHLTAMLLVQDTDNKKQEMADLLQAAQNDELTGLFNRSTVRNKIQSYLSGDGANGTHAIFMIDLDNFKQVNDTFGHYAGDLLLFEIAASIKNCFRDIDILGRMGGDEFFVLAKNIPNYQVARNLAKRLLDVARQVYHTRTTAIGSISIGVSMYPDDGKTVEELYQKADEALYKAKNKGKDQVAFATNEGTSEWISNAFDTQYESFNSKVVDYSHSECYISDAETYEMLHLSKAAMEVYGMTRPEEYRGKKCYQILERLDNPCPFCPNSKLMEGMKYRWERYNQDFSKWYDRTSSLVRLDGRLCHLEIARDITAQKEELDFLSGQLTMEDVLFRCLHTLSSEKDTETAFKRFLEALGGFYQGDRAYIFEFDLENQLLSNTFEWCAEGITSEIDNLQQIPLEVVDGWIRMFRKEGGFSITSLGTDVDPNSEEYRLLEMQGIQSLIAAPLRENGQIIGFIGVDDPLQNQGNLTLLRSVSEFVQAELDRRRLSNDLATALEKANLANQSKSKFLFNMSHDIRTPMNAILGFVMMAEKHIDDKERVLDCLSKLDSAGKHLLRLINDVLDMSRIESGKMSFNLQPHHIPTILKDTQEMFTSEMQKKDIVFTVSWDIQDEFAMLDRLRMDQVELNLVSNALKYTPEGGRVDYSFRQLGKDNDGTATYQISVKDTGIGMAPEFAARVFEPFEREKSSTVNGIQGTGLGLAIVKSLVEQMGGSIICNSELGVGTEFVVTVKLQIASEDLMPKKVEELVTKASFTDKRILLVEDNELNREIAVEILAEVGFIMESAEDGDIAVDMVKKSEPGYYDLILMDIQMPRMDGYTATKAIRALENKELAGIPIIAMTANAFAEDRKNAMEAGMNEHIAKPIDIPKLFDVLRQIL
ncbi:MAG: diguanylate cyclase [Firmicutes bacterium]|nr:diguanylate cyclase [Bacillota bacterium]